MPGAGPFPSIGEALVAACKIIVRQPNAIIPVRPGDQNFDTYWRISREYCAWLYSGRDDEVEMSWLASNPVQVDPRERTCDLPSFVEDHRYEPSSLAYLTVAHNHLYDENLSQKDLRFLVNMARIHGPRATFRGRPAWISTVAFFGREKHGDAECAGFYFYTLARPEEILRYEPDKNRDWSPSLEARVTWALDGTVTIQPVKP